MALLVLAHRLLIAVKSQFHELLLEHFLLRKIALELLNLLDDFFPGIHFHKASLTLKSDIDENSSIFVVFLHKYRCFRPDSLIFY